MKKLLLLVFTLSTLNLFSQAVEPGIQNLDRIQRQGFVFGFGVGGGVISLSESSREGGFDNTTGGISFPNLKFGYMLNERLALMATLPGLIYEYENKDRSFEALIPSIQYWVQDRWWINGGVGMALDMPVWYDFDDFKDGDFNLGCAVEFSTGYELVQGKKFALDLQGQVSLGRAFLGDKQYRDAAMFTVGLGFNWY